tara:strand:- start:5134 stop:5247 length:114 start_codon:yes stop_codon:yes gene_type:complete
MSCRKLHTQVNVVELNGPSSIIAVPSSNALTVTLGAF